MKTWVKPKLISLYRGRPEEAVLGMCKEVALFAGPSDGADCVGTPPGAQCQEIAIS